MTTKKPPAAARLSAAAKPFTAEEPLIAGWSFTSICNLKCAHCYNASGKAKRKEMTLTQAIKVADKLKAAGVAAVNFGGGECCLKPGFIELCRYLKGLGIKISYSTNGTAFEAIEPHLHLFHDIGVSIDFADAKAHDTFRGVPGTFEKAVSTIKKLVANGVDTEIVTCLTKLNSRTEELEKLHNLACSLGVDYWRINRFRSNGRGKDNKSHLALTISDIKSAYTFLSKKASAHSAIPEPIFRSAFGGTYQIEGDPSGSTAFRIQPDGSVTPSVFLSESGGNIINSSLEEIFSSPIFTKIRTRNPKGKCRACPSYHHCRGGDAGASFLEYRHFDGPDPLCWLNPKDKRPMPRQVMKKNWNVHEMYLCTIYIPTK